MGAKARLYYCAVPLCDSRAGLFRIDFYVSNKLANTSFTFAVDNGEKNVSY